eukprot:CAMPEP_0204617298 /NCGR_PEP_ID=MMETSP0717-20131115/4310_1 /ASSEMBLY_ACC=CAM_ASM_000666 /TAXON_ID=230516 /ORGANISM="Chaetoceros curvisetus" /LENGTH=159 /DNA_ID=CAMNT_0051630785 /DNA_START=1 /DNA_END=480 /DNA_ORIENTATION=-
MNDNDEFAVLEHEAFDITSSDFLTIEPPHTGKIEDTPQHHGNGNLYQMNFIPDSASPTIVTSSDHYLKEHQTRASVHSAQLPFLTSSELNERMEQSVSRLAMSMKRSEMSRQRILQNSNGYSSSMITNLLGTSSTLASGLSQSRRVVGSYMNHVGNNSM